jgi:hypothetical protein
MQGGEKDEMMDNTFTSTITRGGHSKFGMTEENMKAIKPHYKPMYVNCNKGREGYFGWFGYGGSVMNFNPELEIGFGYVPFNFVDIDMVNKRGA